MYAQWYSLLLSLKRWHCYALTVLSLVICVGTWLLCFYLPLERRFVHEAMQLTQARKDIVVCVHERECNKQSMQDMQLLQTDYQTCLFDQSTASKQLLHSLFNQASACNVQIVSFKKGTTGKDRHHVCLMHVQAQGKLQDIQAFFERLTMDNRLLIQCCDSKVSRQATGLYTMQTVLKQFVAQKIVENESPSTLEKAEGLGG